MFNCDSAISCCLQVAHLSEQSRGSSWALLYVCSSSVQRQSDSLKKQGRPKIVNCAGSRMIIIEDDSLEPEGGSVTNVEKKIERPLAVLEQT
ncbi:hypothetical protein CDAR_604821 [Caerostris darwini]|uniref:Uncharacterized protein n=1 Tax=Caerostris darwini TaxID=1538125 RepID=A0AAV4VQH4_9ARAC|nr:hypothetical protein CDAR_604821 [Caerostris darwini]